MSLAGKRIGFIGGGAMAEALAGGLVAAGLAPEALFVADVSAERRAHLEIALGARTTGDNTDVAAACDLVVIAVKPADVAGALADIRGPGDALWVSIAAGIPLARLGGALPAGARIVRAMPNTPALVRAGATALCGNDRVSASDLADARALFEGVGLVWQAPEEALLDAVTGLSGSGPAYVFLFLEALVDAGEAAGLPRPVAHDLACQTVYGAAKLALEGDRSPAELREQVTSPGGTTVAGLEQLAAGGFRAALHKAVAAATRRSRELAGS